MDEPVPAEGAHVHLLCVGDAGLVTSDLLAALVRSGIEVSTGGETLDDALREALTSVPDVILLPYGGEATLNFLRTLAGLRTGSFSPYVVLVTEGDYGAALERCDGFYRVLVLPRAKLSGEIIPHLLRIARESRSDD